MAGRWRTAQRRKRWSDHAAMLPEGSLALMEPWPILDPFSRQLESFMRLPSTYAQLTQVKSLGTTLLSALMWSHHEEAGIGLRVFVELLFVENSRPLHRGLLSKLLHVPGRHADVLQRAFADWCQQYGNGGAKERRFAVVGVAQSLVSMPIVPQLGLMRWVAHICAPSMANSLCHDVQSVLRHALEGGRPTPTDMEECQDALSSIYYFLQQFPDRFIDGRYLQSSNEKSIACCSSGRSAAKFESTDSVLPVSSEEEKGVPQDFDSKRLETEESDIDNGESKAESRKSMDEICGSVDALAFENKGPVCGSGEGLTGKSETADNVLPVGCGEEMGTLESSSVRSFDGVESTADQSSRTAGIFHAEEVVENRCCAIVSCLLDVLQTGVLSRDCLVAAGVGLAAAAQICTSIEGLAFVLAGTVFSEANSAFAVLAPSAPLQKGILEPMLIAHRNSTLRAELESLSEFGKLCYVRGLLTAIPRIVQNVHLLRTVHPSSNFQSGVVSDELKSEPQLHAWTLLYDGILPALCRFCESSVDSHFKFHAVSGLQICLHQIKASIYGQMSTPAFNHFQHAAFSHNLTIQSYDPLPPAMINQVLQLIWNNWEDPLTQTVKQVQVVFDLLVDVQLVHRREDYDWQSVQRGDMSVGDNMQKKGDGVGSDSFLEQIANDLLAAGRYRKGKYVPLASLVQRIGARRMLQMCPELLFQTIDAFSDDDVCSSASTFLKIFLERLKEECWNAEGVMEGTVAARRFWIPAVLSGLLTGDPRLRNNLTTYSLPVALQIDSDSLLVILGFILDIRSPDTSVRNTLSWEELEGSQGLPNHLSLEQQVILLISFLKVARSLALVEGSIGHSLKPVDEGSVPYEEDNESAISKQTPSRIPHAIFCVSKREVEVPVSLLLMALTHKEDGLRVDAAELMCLNPKTAAMPAPLELCLLRIALPLNMRCSSTSFRMRWTGFLRKFFHRVCTAVERQQKAEGMGTFRVNLVESEPEDGSGQDSGSPVLTLSSLYTTDIDNSDTPEAAVSLKDMQEFMQWFSQMLVSSMYPSAPYERKSMAMELFNALIEVWSLKDSLGKRSGEYISSPNLDSLIFTPYHKCLLSEDFTLVVVGAIVDSWDKLREDAYRILVRYPTPLPGLDSESKIEELLNWAKGMVSSPRVREGDAGALAFRLIFRKYVLDLGWIVRVHPQPKVMVTFTSQGDSKFVEELGGVVLHYLESLNDWLEWGIEEADNDLLKACSHSFVHGVLLVLRYTVEEIDWTSPYVQTCVTSFRATIARLVSLLLRVTTLALWVVSADALNLQEQLGGSSPHACTISEDQALESVDLAFGVGALNEQYDSDTEGSHATAEQMVMVGCWLSVKEVSLLLGTMARVVPLPGSTIDPKRAKTGESEIPQKRSPPDSKDVSPMLDGKQLEAIGSHFVQVLLSMKHTGAIDKTRTGFIALCDRLLQSSDPELNKLPEVWLQQLMDHTCAEGQVVDDLLRRSAGIPPAFLSLFLSEPDGSPKKLLPVAIDWLIKQCKKFLTETGVTSQLPESELERSKCLDENHLSVQTQSEVPSDDISWTGTAQLGAKAGIIASKLRDEGVVPTVHAFNILRMTFHDTNLAIDTSGFCADGLIIAIQAFASSHWEVRNSATLAFTALVHRTIGFLNVYKRESARRAITGFEFFHRYPTLHPFLLKELQSATWQLQHGTGGDAMEGNRLVSSLHPSLAPVLIILSRLKPSFINSDVEDWLNPSAFIPYVTQCATQRNLHVRVLASRALSPLVSSEDLPRVLLLLAQSLPVLATQKASEVSTTDYKASSFNAIHGVLLQMCALLTANCLILPDLDECCKILTQVLELVEERLWLGSINLCGCYTVIGAFLDMLGGLLSLARACQEKLSSPESLITHLQSLVTQLSSECLDALPSEVDLHDSTKVGLREKAARLYFETMLTRHLLKESHRPSKPNFESNHKDASWSLDLDGDSDGNSKLSVKGSEMSSLTVSDGSGQFAIRLRKALVDNSYEVRLAILKVLKKYCNEWAGLKQSIVRPGDKVHDKPIDLRFLRPLIVLRLTVEKHPLCIHRILQVIYLWALIDKSEEGVEVCDGHCGPLSTLRLDSVWDSGLSLQELWSSLLNIYNKSKQIKTKEAALRCLGSCVHLLWSGVDNLIGSSDLVEAAAPTSDMLSEFNEKPEIRGSQVLESPKHLVSVSPTQDKSKIREAVNTWLEVVNTWLAIVRTHSAASEPVNFRRATAEAIVASGILDDVKRMGLRLSQRQQENDPVDTRNSTEQHLDLEWYAKAVLSAWCLCIKLLEDEDPVLRQNLSLAMLEVIARSDMQQTSGIVPAQVEKVIQVSFEFLCAQFGCWREYYDVLAQWVLGADDDIDVIGGDFASTRRLFDKEIDNHHEEELLFVQLSSLHLRKLMHIPADNGSSSLTCVDGEKWPNDTSKGTWYNSFVWKWRRKYLERANACAQSSLQIKNSMQWVGGITNHQDTFKHLYRSLVGLLIFAGPMRDDRGQATRSYSSDEEELICGLANLSSRLRTLPLNPLVSNTLVQVLQAYEQQLEVVLDSFEIRKELGAGYCANFDPLFLIS